MRSLDQIYAEAGRVEEEVDRLNAARRESERYENWMQKRPAPAHIIKIKPLGLSISTFRYFYLPTCSCGWRTKGVTQSRDTAEQQGAAHKALGAFGLQEKL